MILCSVLDLPFRAAVCSTCKSISHLSLILKTWIACLQPMIGFFEVWCRSQWNRLTSSRFSAYSPDTKNTLTTSWGYHDTKLSNSWRPWKEQLLSQFEIKCCEALAQIEDPLRRYGKSPKQPFNKCITYGYQVCAFTDIWFITLTIHVAPWHHSLRILRDT